MSTESELKENTIKDLTISEKSEVSQNSIINNNSTKFNTHNARNSPINRCFLKSIWIAFLIGAFFGFAINTSQLILHFNSTPTSIVFEQRSEAFIWPDVTVCISNLVNDQKVINTLNSKYRQSDSFLVLYKAYVHFKNSPVFVAFKNFNVQLWSVFNTLYRFPDFLTEVYEVILQCKFKGCPCSFLNFTTHRHPEKLNCFTFKPLNRTPGLPGPAHGLNLILDLVAFDDKMHFKNPLPENFNGFTIAVHSPNTLPDLDKDFVEVGVGYSVDIEIKAKHIRKFNRTSSPCYKRENASMFGFEKYISSSVSCQDAAIQRVSVERCGCQRPYRYKMFTAMTNGSQISYPTCLDVSLKLPSNISYEHDDLATQSYDKKNYPFNLTLRPSFQETLSCYMDFSELFILMNTKCPTYCTDIKYTISSSSKRWPGYTDGFDEQILTALLNNARLIRQVGLYDTFYQLIHINNYKSNVIESTAEKAKAKNTSQDDQDAKLKYLRRRFSFVRIFLGDTRVDGTREVASYNCVNLLSDIGGLMGLWIGVSFITIFDVLEIVLPLVLRSFYSIQKDETKREICIQL